MTCEYAGRHTRCLQALPLFCSKRGEVGEVGLAQASPPFLIADNFRPELKDSPSLKAFLMTSMDTHLPWLS